MSYRVGLSGGIGCGKSTVAALFHEQGITVIDADTISHRLTQAGGAAVAPIRAAFGPESIDAAGALDRARMRNIVFSDPDARRTLEAILHPLIRARMLAEAEADSESPYLLLVVPLLFEAPGYRELVDRAAVVDCAAEVQLARTIARSALREQEVRAIMAQQMPRAERIKLADDVIHNDGGMEELRAQVMRLHRLYLGRSSETNPRSSLSREGGN